jgi:hypothetical protein
MLRSTNNTEKLGLRWNVTQQSRPFTCHESIREIAVKLHAFLTSALDDCECLASPIGGFTPRRGCHRYTNAKTTELFLAVMTQDEASRFWIRDKWSDLRSGHLIPRTIHDVYFIVGCIGPTFSGCGGEGKKNC